MLSIEPDIGELERGYVLIEGEQIAAVGERLDDADAELLDVSGHAVLPGFVDMAETAGAQNLARAWSLALDP